MHISSKKGLVVWLVGLSGAGKTTLSKLLSEKLLKYNIQSVRLDGDELRYGLNASLGFSIEDRSENVRRTAEIAKIISESNVVTICSLITPLTQHRKIASEILGEQYFEVFIDCPLETCEQRDVKGLYRKAHENTIKNFTGVGSKFEAPENSNLVICTAEQTEQDSLDLLLHAFFLKTGKPADYANNQYNLKVG